MLNGKDQYCTVFLFHICFLHLTRLFFPFIFFLFKFVSIFFRSQSCEAGLYSNIIGERCKNCDAGRYRQSKKDNEWTFTITTQDITASAGVAVTQTVSGDMVTGTLQTTLTGADTKTIVVAATTGGAFISTTDIVIGTGGGTAITIAHATITKVDKITPTDPTTCLDCIVGRYQPETGQASCLPCIPGSFMNSTGALKCVKCGKNQKSEDAGAKECDNCIVGKTSEAGSAKCQRCSAGKAGTLCTKCLVGEFRAGSDTDATTCDACPEGRYQSEEGQGSW